jgi:hypothetical protein
LVGGIAGRTTGRISACFVSGAISGQNWVGGVAGTLYEDNSQSMADGCHASCSVSSDTGYDIGGLIGSAQHTNIVKCYATGPVKGGTNVGGLAGINISLSYMNNCYATGPVAGKYYVGGLIGANRDDGHVSKCYATGAASGTGSVTNLVGSNYGAYASYSWGYSSVYECYGAGPATGSNAPVGGLVGGGPYDSVKSCYWDFQTSGLPDSLFVQAGYSGGPLTTAEMKQANYFWGFDFGSTWKIRTDSTYPGLAVLDNAPFAFADSLLWKKATFNLDTLLLNDCDIETGRKNLVLRVVSASNGTTDSVKAFAFTTGAKGTVATIRYRVGEIRTTDTLWGNMALARITLDTTLVIAVRPDVKSSLPTALALGVTPDHYTSSTMVRLSLPASALVTLKLFDCRGRRVVTIIDNEVLPGGVYARQWNSGMLSKGVYLFRLQAGKATMTKKVCK